LSNPDGIDAGAYTNFTDDRYFSMERLSVMPWSLARVTRDQTLPFHLADDITTRLSTVTLASLQQSGRLFLVDHSDFASLATAPGKYAAACQAYFFLHPSTDDFLPLAIKTNVGADLIYTPLDSFDDWYLAKTLLESNEAAWTQISHLSLTHSAAEIVHESALRTLADQHPVRGFLDRGQS
jgi:hypothetical protein